MKETKTPVSFRMHNRIIDLITDIAEKDEISRADLLEFLVLEHAYNIGILSRCDEGFHFSKDKFDNIRSKHE